MEDQELRDMWLTTTIRSWKSQENSRDLQCKRLRDFLVEHGKRILKKDPNVFLELVERAPQLRGAPELRESTHFMEILKKFAETYKTLPNKPQVGPLEHLMKQQNFKSSFGCWAQLQPVFEILIAVDDSQNARSECLREHVIQMPGSPNSIQPTWTYKNMNIMKLLLRNGADPTWIPEGSGQSVWVGNAQSTLCIFFNRIPKMVLFYNHYISELEELFSLFLTEKSLNHKEAHGTVLHALMDFNHNWPSDCDRLNVIVKWILIIIKASPSLVDVKDCEGRTPLQCFVRGVTIKADTLMIVKNTVQMLKSETNVSAQDKSGHTILHYLAIFIHAHHNHKTSDESQSVAFDLVKCLVSSSNIDTKDKYGQTALHILTRAIFCQPDVGQDLVNILRLFASSNNVNAVDDNSVTPYSLILRGKEIHEDGHGGTFSTIENIFLEHGACFDLARIGITGVHHWELTMLWNNLSRMPLAQWDGNIPCLRFSEHLPGIPERDIMFYRQTSENSHCFFESSCYKMLDIHKTFPQKSIDIPLELARANQTENIFSLIKMLTLADNKEESRTKCLQALIMNAKYTSWYGDLAWIQWTEEFINILKLLLSNGADPTWIPDGWQEAAVHKFFECVAHIIANENHLYSALMHILPFFLSEKCLTQTDCQCTILHALVGSTWEWLPDNLPKNFFDQYRDVVSKVVDANPAMVNMIDSNGRSPLQCFLIGIKACKYALSNIVNIVQILKSWTNINTQDKSGRTVLHYLVEVLTLQECCESLDKVYLSLIQQIRSTQNIDMQDENGHTALYVLARTVVLRPNTGHHLLGIFPLVTTSQNVNAKDDNSVTPYSWILNGKAASRKFAPYKRKIFSAIEEILLCHEADTDLATTGSAFLRISEQEHNVEMQGFLDTEQILTYPQLKNNIDGMNTSKDLDKIAQQILNTLSCDGHRMIRRDPSLFLSMVKNSQKLIASQSYVKIIKAMAEIYKTTKFKSQRELQPLALLVHTPFKTDDGTRLPFLQHQDRFLLLIKILIDVDPGLQSRKECLEILLKDSEHASSHQQVSFQYTENFLATLKLLLLKETDPSCSILNEQCTSIAMVLAGGVPYQTKLPVNLILILHSQHSFFRNLIHMLANNIQLTESGVELLGLSLSEKHLTNDFYASVFLQALVTFSWNDLCLDLPAAFPEQFKRIVTKVVHAKPTMVDEVNRDGKNPLQCFLENIIVRKDIFRSLSDVVLILKTDTNISNQDTDGRTALHYLCEIFPLDNNQPDSLSHLETFLSLVTGIKSINNTEIQDDNGQTALHILARAAFLHPNLALGIDAVFDVLTTPKNVNTLDNDFVTPYSWILQGKKVHERSKSGTEGLFTKLEKIFFTNGANTAIAETGLVSTLLIWIRTELADKKCSLDRLKVVFNHMNTKTDWSSPFYSRIMTFDVIRNLTVICDPDFVPIIMGILRKWLSKECASLHSWQTLSNWPGILSTTHLESLYFCARDAAQLMPRDIMTLLGRTEDIIRHGDQDTTFLKTLLLLQMCNISKAQPTGEYVSLIDKMQQIPDFLGNRYIICKEVYQLARRLIHGLFGTFENCMKSNRLLNCLLLISIKQERRLHLQGIQFDHMINENCFQRGPLHLAVMLLDNQKILECLPQHFIKQHINDQDLHGCTPLHLAYLHHNDMAVQFLIKNGANINTKDKYGMTPECLYSLVTAISRNGTLETVHLKKSKPLDKEQADDNHYQLCCTIMTTKSGVLESMRPMLVFERKEIEDLINELQLLFERLIKETQFRDGKVVMAGSLRECLKVGRLDEADIQIQFIGATWPVVQAEAYKVYGLEVLEFKRQVCDTLISNIGRISWDGIYLRPISFTEVGPWKFVRDGASAYRGMTISVDIVPILIHEEDEDQGCEQLLREIVEDAPLHQRRSFTIYSMHNKLGERHFSDTRFALDWNIIDSLPLSGRLAIGITKALVQAYEWYKSNNRPVKMPITSYMLKTALFFILAGKSKVPTIAEALLYAHETSAEDMKKGEKNTSKLKFNPNPTWITDDDVNHHAEDARLLAQKMLRFIKYFAMHGFQLQTYWSKEGFGNTTAIGEKEYVQNMCDYLLKRLERNAFY